MKRKLQLHSLEKKKNQDKTMEGWCKGKDVYRQEAQAQHTEN